MSNSDRTCEEKRLQALHDYDVLDTAPEEAFDRITRLAKSALHMPIVLVSLVDENRQWFKSRQGLDASQTPRDISFCTHAIEQHGPFMIPDAQLDERFRDNPLVTGDPNIRFYLGIPLRSPDGYNIGTLCAIDTIPRELSDTEVNLLSDMARLVVDELELRQIACTDSLTGAQTRRSFYLDVEKEMERAKRYGRTVAFVAFDIDHFKRINDTYGHSSGDLVLQNVASICKSALRGMDVFGRLGGEEFVIVLPETDRLGAMEVAERLRKKIENTPVVEAETSIQVTASFGVTVFRGEEQTARNVLNWADEALYEAKGGGRNRIVFIGEEEDLSVVA